MSTKSILIEEVRTQEYPSFPRIDGVERVTGRSKYAGDWKVPDMLFGRVVGSTIANGIVRRVDSRKAESMTGVKAVITCLENGTTWSKADHKHVQSRVFANRVRFVGDIVAAVAATNRAVALEAAEAIEVEYEELPAVFSPDEAKKTNAPKVWEDGNLLMTQKFGYGDIPSAFSKADLVVEQNYSTQRVHNSTMEPATSLAWWEDGGRLTLVAGTQALHRTWDDLATDLNMPKEKIRVIAQFKGGAFGGYSSSMNFNIIAALLAKKTGRPVKLEYSRLDDFVRSHGRWSTDQHLRVAVNAVEGKLLAMDIHGFCDVGSHKRHATQISKLLGAPENYYAVEAWNVEVDAIYTNTPATGPMRAPSQIQATFATETIKDEIAYRLQINPLQFTERNIAVKHPNGSSFTSNGMRDCIRLGAATIGWKERWRPPPNDIKRLCDKRFTGLGFAIGARTSPLGKGEAILKLKCDGILEVSCGIIDIGTGAKTTMAIMASSAARVPLEKVFMIYGDTASGCPYSRGEVGNITNNVGMAVRAAGIKIREKLTKLAAVRFNVSTRDIFVDHGYVTTRDGRKAEIGTIIADSGLDFIQESIIIEPKQSDEGVARLSFTAHFAEVEVDIETGQTKVKRYVVGIDSGEIINRLTAENQVRGSVIMGLGMALSEKLIIDPNFGSVQNPSFLNYRLPNNMSVPRIEVIFTTTKDPYGPKTIGEVAILPTLACVGNAIFNATGKRLRRTPFAAQDLLREIE